MKNTIDFKKMGFKTIEEYDKFLNDRMEFMMGKIKSDPKLLNVFKRLNNK